MRKEFVAAMTDAAVARPDLIFMTGDLGFMALEPLQKAIGTRFINAGVAEQNMVSVAAGLATQGFCVVTYSIAPFMILRPYEQIRDDVCLHNVNVKLVGNGGGYGYGIMGGTHHLLEDFACLAGLPNMRIFVPCFGSDVGDAVNAMVAHTGPAYLRLGLGAELSGFTHPGPMTTPWRCINSSSADNPVVVLGIGPVMGNALAAAAELPRERVEAWVCGELPFGKIPSDLLAKIARAERVICVEEHYGHGGFGSALSLALMKQGAAPRRFIHAHAQGYPSGRYGNQNYHLRESGLDKATIARLLVDAQ